MNAFAVSGCSAFVIGAAAVVPDDMMIRTRDEAMRLNNDIQNLLDAARITSQGLQSRRDWTDPTDLIDAAVERISRRYPNHEINLDVGRNLPLVHVDPVLVEQALGQIIANAAKFSPPASTIQIAAHTENQQLIISVIDKGVGLTTDEKARLAERFFRGQRHDGKISGSGLGMWIANTFIMSNGGILEARPFRKSYPGILIVQSG